MEYREITLQSGCYYEFVGLHSATKPTEGIGIFSLFLELDTRDLYYFDGTTWKKVGE